MNIIHLPKRLGTVCLTAHELDLLAGAIKTEAAAHDRQSGSCPSVLWDATERARQLESLAEQVRGAAL